MHCEAGLAPRSPPGRGGGGGHLLADCIFKDDVENMEKQEPGVPIPGTERIFSFSLQSMNCRKGI